MAEIAANTPRLLDPRKFRDPEWTADGERRASVFLRKLETLWICTGTLCNLECKNCYIESSPRNDRLVYISLDEVTEYLDEIEREGLGTQTLGFTGGEPFMNPDMIPILRTTLERGFDALVLTNAMKPMMKRREELLALRESYGDQLTVRVSVDHYRKDLHEQERGPRAWEPMVRGLYWLTSHGFQVDIAGRLFSGESESEMRAGYADFFARNEIALDAHDPAKLVLFPEMDASLDVPEITVSCWEKTGQHPDDMMCASSRMVVKRKGEDRPVVVPCTLLPYEPEFELSHSLRGSFTEVPLNHPHCSKFCVLGGGKCGG